MELLYKYRKFIKEVVPVGSRITCNPPPTDTDEDFLVLTTDFQSLVEDLMEDGYEVCGEEDYVMPIEEHGECDFNFFQSFRKGDINLIVTESKYFFNKFVRATKIAKKANLLEKENRVVLFQHYLYNAEDLYEYLDYAHRKEVVWGNDDELVELLKALEK